MKEIKLALIGKNIAHSKSKAMYEKLLGRSVNYTLIDCENESDIPSIKELSEKYIGVSITSPYKTHFLKNVRLEPENLFAINCLKFSKDDECVGTNTDYLATLEIIERYKNTHGIEEVLILGNGVMAQVTELALNELNLSFKSFSRSKRNLDNVGEFIKNNPTKTLIINCCAREYCFNPPKVDGYYFWDMNYELEHHQNLFNSLNVHYTDGLELLENQAKYALKVWNLD